MRKFLASVGNAQLLGKVGGEFRHIADVRTLTDSTLSFSNSMDEIRAGEGAQLYGRFSHDAGMTIQLTDAMFDMNYIALQVGFNLNSLEAGNATAFFSEEKPVATGAATLSHMPSTIGSACGLDKVVVWYRAQGCDAKAEWNAIVLDSASTSITGLDVADGTYCFRYFTAQAQAHKLLVNANFIPAELVLILTTKLFAGDANAPETGKAVGEITVKIPRFQLDGQFDLSMAMSSPSSMSLNGTALATNASQGCEDTGVYAEIVEIEYNSVAATGLKDVVISTDSTTTSVTVFGLYADGHMSTLGTFTESTTDPHFDLGKIGTTAYSLHVTINTTSTPKTATATVYTKVGSAEASATNMTDTFTFPTQG